MRQVWCRDDEAPMDDSTGAFLGSHSLHELSCCVDGSLPSGIGAIVTERMGGVPASLKYLSFATTGSHRIFDYETA